MLQVFSKRFFRILISRICVFVLACNILSSSGRTLYLPSMSYVHNDISSSRVPNPTMTCACQPNILKFGIVLRVIPMYFKTFHAFSKNCRLTICFIGPLQNYFRSQNLLFVKLLLYLLLASVKSRARVWPDLAPAAGSVGL